MPVNSKTHVTPHFQWGELRCHDGTAVPDTYMKNAIAICKRAEALREYLGEPLIVTSGFRTKAWNDRVGGAKGSLHLTARALDLTCRSVSAKEMHTAYLALIKAGKVPDGGLGLYKNWIHIDTWKPRRWSSGVEVK